MPISSYVIRCLPGRADEACRALQALPEVTLGDVSDLGMTVVTETDTTQAAQQLGDRLQTLPGVLSAVLVYHNFEDVAEESGTLRRVPHDNARVVLGAPNP